MVSSDSGKISSLRRCLLIRRGDPRFPLRSSVVSFFSASDLDLV
ncbi:hypothetical protein ISN45_Aa04g024170 [Arabidopsis thaliana x Arabidopsis arenosa]|uniref:Uncharacterized protein n=1 Tax=Arabidopsis thaliana x Arabidopsis arenosa TaxID=1240361 RepID=A0A8T2A816_9BRAS|nr:hypothetical protein ISN45_Aa04g024170 [Arabidopsis thaliana x Arabidopsis arenosa]